MQVLMVDDDTSFTMATQEILEILGHQVVAAASVEEAKTQLAVGSFDILLLDIMLPDGSGFEVLDSIPTSRKPRHITFITGQAAIKNMIRSVAGSDVSFLLKPIDIDKIRALLAKVELAESNKDASVLRHFGVLIGESAPMQSLYKMIERVGASQANVMIMGESGSGKELIARAIHNASQCEGAFVAANCGAMPTELIGSELFGHEKGAFTGAASRKAGLFERAHGGTLFLDEITEMPLELQPNLLRVLETGRITRLGGTQEIDVHCRVLSATNRTREQLATEQCLREDIYFRLAVFPVQSPTLSQRREDIPLLCNAFLAELNEDQGCALTIDEASMARLQNYSWPGNVRELRHAIHRSFIMTDPGQDNLQLPDDLSSPFSKELPTTPSLAAGKTIQEMEKELIMATLAEVNDDKPKAATMLGISLKTLYNRLNQYENSQLSALNSNVPG
ncbi:sigma-54-dependent Fis family transcriptional regulator [Ketobacter sp. MCCC 1A13808]|uniref:sigma-54-dependent transcriptional regulator n=1 Tax=Ketobacter sp. MCCC 1A13808 TaxID=2602738 RepID=UPI0012EC499A|nr:sigma-54 dependent transcriptional regulator [Ketobacter sp. MCCC 1A13808]MVF14249.1 sigma-54-dependent Fis family transcriptional regulator [Ketobacter sp. MCCC 1A13808]